MSAVGIAEALRLVVVFGEEERGVGTLSRVVIKQLIDRSKQALRVVQRDDSLAAQVGLQVRHQKSGGNSLACDVAQDESDAILAEMKEVVVVAADLASLDADSGVVEGPQWWERLRKEARLDLFGDVEFMSGAPFRFEFGCGGTALCLDCLGHFVKAHQGEGIAVNILEAGKHATPNRRLLSKEKFGCILPSLLLILDASQTRHMTKADSAAPPLRVGSYDILRYKSHWSRLADQLVFVRVGFRCD